MCVCLRVCVYVRVCMHVCVFVCVCVLGGGGGGASEGILDTVCSRIMTDPEKNED